jgi:fructan beta-fructosidase
MGVSIGGIFNSLTCQISGSRTCETLFSDEFENLDSWEVVHGKWEIEEGKLCGGPGKGRIFTELDDDDYIITLNNANLSKGKGFGVYFRTSNHGKVDGYNFQFDPGYKKGSFILRKWVNGRQLKPFAITKVPNFDWYNQDYKMQIHVIGDTFSVFINDEEVLTGTDDTYQSGGVGFRTWNKSEVCIDSISVDHPTN